MSGVLALLRHGRTALNEENRFSGTIDADVTKIGQEEVAKSGREFIGTGIRFTKAYSSPLIRAKHSATIFLEAAGQSSLINRVEYSDALKGRNEGVLAGKSRPEAYAEHGKKLVTSWLTSYDQAPPQGETRLEMYEQRVEPFYHQNIRPDLERGENVLIVSHHSTIRALFRAHSGGTLEQSDSLVIENGSLLILDHQG